MPRNKRTRKPETRPKKYSTVPYAIRVRIVEAVMRGATHDDVARAFGVSSAVVGKYITLFDIGGNEALHPRRNDRTGRFGLTRRRRCRARLAGTKWWLRARRTRNGAQGASVTCSRDSAA